MTELEIGGVICAIDFRRTDEDRGPSIRVFGDCAGQRVQLLRFDCFENDPHYHYAPTGTNQVFHLDPLTMGSPVGFSLCQLSLHTQAMVAKAGYAEFAAGIDQEALAAGIDSIREAIAVEEAAGE